MNRVGRFILAHETAFAVLLIVCGALLRTLYTGSCPAGLNQDEASAGYEAWSLLHYGIDRNGQVWPVLFISWGSGQNVLYSYLSMPIIAALGLNEFSVRLLSALAGTVSLPVFWRLGRRTVGPAFGLAALFALTFCPWHIMLSRWALESNLLPFFLLLGIYFAVCSMEKPRMLAASAVSFGLSLYAYGTAFVFLPPFLIMAAAYLLKCGKLRPLPFIASALVFAVIALPITLCNLRNALGLPSMSLFGLTLPALTQTRQTATMGFSAKNFADFLKILVTQSDGLSYNSVKGFMFFPLYYIFAAAGAVFSAMDERREKRGAFFMSAAAVSCLAASFFIDVNINRMNMAFIPLCYLSAYGLYGLCRMLGSIRSAASAACCVLACALILGSAGYAGSVYLTEGQKARSDDFFSGLGGAVTYARSLNPDTVYITDSVNMPYIFALFYSRTPTPEFCSTVQYANPDGAFRQAVSYEGYIFESGDADLYILRCDECGGREILAEFGNYDVCR